MANMFDTYPDVVDETTISAGESVHEAEWEHSRKKKKKSLKAQIKAMKKQAKKQAKLTKKLMKEWKAAAKQKCSKVKRFFNGLGKAVCKTVPVIVTALATAVIGHFFGIIPKGWQRI